ncbi:YSIRK-type signal peptide-containing protein, partial [Lactobacillus kitasatonis]
MSKMLSKNNFNEKLRQMDNQRDHFSIRKLTIGAASVLIGISFMGFGGQAVHADEVTNTQPAVEQVSKETTTDSTQQNNDAQKDAATAQKTEVATDSQANNTKESAQLVKPITEADVKATTESQKAEIADKTNEVKPSDTQVQEKQKEQTSEVKTPDTTSDKDEQKSDQTQSLVVDKKATENTQAATDIAAEKVKKTVQLQAKIQALIALPAESESQFNVDDWNGSLNNTTHEYTLDNYHGDNKNIYIPNTQDFINAGRISSDDKVYITKDLMKSITSNGAVNITVDDQGEKNKVYAKGDWNHAFSGYTTHLQHVDLSHVDTSGVTNMNNLFSGSHDLQSVNFRGCDLSNVTDTSYMFAYVGGKI